MLVTYVMKPVRDTNREPGLPVVRQMEKNAIRAARFSAVEFNGCKRKT